jgi:hypothetical protein
MGSQIFLGFSALLRLAIRARVLSYAGMTLAFEFASSAIAVALLRRE